MKLRFRPRLVLCLAVVFLLAGFAAPQMARAQKKLSFAAHFGPKNEIYNHVLIPWAKEIKKQTNFAG